ncbi:MAG: shikimate dehydrogenase [Verrucomicrobiota bacterium]
MAEEKQKYAVIGWPIEHSASPQMHNAGFRASGIKAVYERIATPPAKLSATIDKLIDKGFRGWNVTVPHKEAVIPFLDDISPEAELAGSVNTIAVSNGRLRGYSTDGFGLEQAIQEAFHIPAAGHSFFFIGAGGATKATAVHYARQGADKIWVINRTIEKARQICGIINTATKADKAQAVALSEQKKWQQLLNSADVIIQATSLGLKDDDPLPIPAETIPENKNIYDMIYRLTPFLQEARKRNCQTAAGEGMLLYQGVKSFELWTGQTAPAEAMRRALKTAMAERD